MEEISLGVSINVHGRYGPGDLRCHNIHVMQLWKETTAIFKWSRDQINVRI